MNEAKRAPILVTGGASRLARALAAERPETVVALRRAELDIASADSVAAALDRVAPGVVINAAGFTHVDKAEAYPEEARRSNVAGPETLARACAARGVPLIHVSTDLVFGEGGPWREDDTPAPLGVYGRTKLEGARAVVAAGGSYAIARTAWLFGYQGDFLHRMLTLAATGDRIQATNDQFSSPTPIAALARRLLMLGDRMQANEATPPILHFAGNPGVSRFDWLAYAYEAAIASGAKLGPLEAVPMRSIPTPARRPSNSVLDTTRADALFGGVIDWRPDAAALGRAWASQHG